MTHIADQPVPRDALGTGDRRWAFWSWIFPIPIALIVLLTDRLRQRAFPHDHAVQALVLASLNLVQLAVFVWLFGLGLILLPLIWVYGVIVGFRALRGKQAILPLITYRCRRRGWITQ